MQIFARLTKVDEATRRVWGRATQEVPDRSGEIMDYDSSKPLFEAWSGTMSKASDGKSVGNLRSMHGKVAAGKLVELEFNDLEKAIDVCAEVVDEVEFQKCLKGVYTGFSVGGSYAKKWSDKANPLVKRYTAKPTEISLVDLPCVPTAAFTLVKADGMKADVEFQVKDDPDALAKLAAAEEAKPEPEAEAVNALAKLFDGGTVKPSEVLELLAKRDADADAGKKAAAVEELKKAVADDALGALTNGMVETLAKAHLPAVDLAALPEAGPQRMGAAIAALRKAAGVDGTPEGLEAALAKVAEPAEPEALALAKGLWTVCDLAQLVMSLNNVQSSTAWEADAEGDASPIPARLKEAVSELGQILCEMVEEETAELDTAEKMAKVEQAYALLKVGKRNSAADGARLQGIHDHSVKMGATCDSKDDMAKVVVTGDLSKAFVALNVTSDEAAIARIEELKKGYNAWANMPALPKGALRAVPKSEDGATSTLAKNDGGDTTHGQASESADPMVLMKDALSSGVAGAPALRKSHA